MTSQDLTAKIIVLIGLPGSGKSTLRDKLMAANVDDDFVIISSDNEIESLCAAAGLTYQEGYKKFIGKATHIMKQNFREAVNNGRNIIWDQTNLTMKKRRGILSQLPKGYVKEAISVEVTAAQLKERLDRREQETGKYIPPQAIKDMANRYVPPTKVEGFDKVTIVK